VTAVNHILVGSIVAVAVKQPVIALPLALASHYALDALPHYGLPTWADRRRHAVLFCIVITLDIIFSLALFAFLAISAPWYVVAAGFLAYSPDLMWVYRYLIKGKFGSIPFVQSGKFTQFHKRIQKREFYLGLYVEVPLMVVLFLSVRNIYV
jgi:hypothetical protein